MATPPSPPKMNTNTSTLSTTNPFSLLSKCTSLQQLKQIQAISIKVQLQNDLSILTKLIKYCTKNPSKSSMEHSHKMFDQIPEPDIALFNAMARGYSRSDTPFRALSLFVQMLCYGIAPDDYSFPPVVKVCAILKALEEGKELHCVSIKLGFSVNGYLCPTLIHMYAECNDLVSARRVFDKFVEPCVVSYNAIILGYARSSRPNEALSLFREMQANNVKPSYVTMLSVLSSCALLGALELGKWIHEYTKWNGFDQNVKVNTALIDMYAKCGSLDDAVSVFESMNMRDTQAWSAMIMAYAVHGNVGKALSVFEDMKKACVFPDEITFLGLLYACSHTGLVEQGSNFFYGMKEKYGIVPGIKHYGCMVDLLGRVGRLDEAFNFIEEMPIKATPILWRTLLSACSSHGNVDLGMRVMERIFEFDDSHGGDYVILSNLCAQHGKWEHVNYLRKLMNEKEAIKIPGCSSVEVNNVVHEFFAGDGVNFNSQELLKTVDEIVQELKNVGYVPDTSLVCHEGMEDEEKELTLRYHSEKLAITYGLLNTAPGTTIRVVKNLRVCGDCHSAAKFISMIFNRQIILRDVQRFHHFKDGKCSCADFW